MTQGSDDKLQSSAGIQCGFWRVQVQLKKSPRQWSMCFFFPNCAKDIGAHVGDQNLIYQYFSHDEHPYQNHSEPQLLIGIFRFPVYPWKTTCLLTERIRFEEHWKELSSFVVDLFQGSSLMLGFLNEALRQTQTQWLMEHCSWFLVLPAH